MISGSFTSSPSFSQIREFYASQHHPRGTNNKMADGSGLVEEYSKRAKMAVGFEIPFKVYSEQPKL